LREQIGTDHCAARCSEKIFRAYHLDHWLLSFLGSNHIRSGGPTPTPFPLRPAADSRQRNSFQQRFVGFSDEEGPALRCLYRPGQCP
jgi:hypothetical protein